MRNKNYLTAALLLIILLQIGAIIHFNLMHYLVPRSSINKFLVSFKGCQGYPRGSDLCKAIQHSRDPNSFTVHGKYIHSKPYAHDTNWMKYDAETGDIVETCGFWIGFATQKKPPCATPEELEDARKNM